MTIYDCKKCGRFFNSETLDECPNCGTSWREGREHEHLWEPFVEQGCVDNKTYLVCKCGRVKPNG